MVINNSKQRIFHSIASLGVLLLIILAYVFGAFDTLQSQLTDRFFTTTKPSSDILIIDIDEESLAAIGQWPWPRSVHAQLLEKIGTARTIGFDVLFTEPSNQGPADDLTLAAAIENFNGEVIVSAIIDEQSGRITYPIEELRSGSIVGFVNTKPERDSVVRTAELKRSNLAAFDTVLAGSNAPINSVRIYFHGPAKTYTTLSYNDVYSGNIPNELFANKTILVGTSAAGLGDTYQTPFGAMPGVEIHANTIETLRSGTFLTYASPLVVYISFFLISLITLLLVIMVRSVLRLSLSLFGVFAGLMITAYLAFSVNIIIPHLYLFILFFGTTGLLLVLQYLFESKEKSFIRNSFSQYVAPEVISELYDSPEKLSLGGETRELTILFSDIRGFTTISEQLNPQQLMTQLNEYLEEMSEAIMQNRGLVDKYIGDAVMAFWGAPLENRRHAIDACESVLVMMKALKKLNLKWREEDRPEFQIGVGVSTGDVVVGNMGSRRRFNYSIIGDEVNFSARIEGLTKQYGVECLIGETTYKAIMNEPHLHTRELDDVMVKGKVEPRKIYQLLTSELTSTTEELLHHFATGRRHYLAGNFSAAVKAFEAALQLDQNDGPSKVFKERSEALVENPPTDWTGVFEFKTK